MSGPEVVYIDPRVAMTMKTEPESLDDHLDLIGYVRQDVHEKAVRASSSRGQETIVQILTNPDGRLVGLSSWGRVWAFVSDTKEGLPAWILVADQLPVQDLDS